MTLGLVCMDSTENRSKVGDKNGVHFILECFKTYIHDPSLAKWCLWALIVSDAKFYQFQ